MADEASTPDGYIRGYTAAMERIDELIHDLQSSIADVLHLHDPSSHSGGLRPPAQDTPVLMLHTMYTTLEALLIALAEQPDAQDSTLSEHRPADNS